MTTTLTPTDVPLEERAEPTSGAAYDALVRRLSQQSVVKHFDAYADVPWDDPAYAIDPADPRWELPPDDPLGSTAWYRALPQPVRARLGLHTLATFAKIGAQFENVLQRGLLEYAWRLPSQSAELRYAYHEVIEEGQHSLMFHELVNRTGLEISGLPRWQRVASRRVVAHARRFPALFFVFVLGGEDPIDHVQREALRSGRELHPLVRRIMQIHVTEEARHLCFARHYLRRTVPKQGFVARTLLALGAPIILSQMAARMMRVSPEIAREYAIPKAVLREAYRSSPLARRQRLAALAKVRALCAELGIVTTWSRPLWQLGGIWEATPRATASGMA